MLPHDKKLALSPVEVEQARDMRNRLSRKAVSDKALGALGTAFFEVCRRLELPPGPTAAADLAAPPAAIVRLAGQADMTLLSRLVALLQPQKQKSPETWPAIVAAGAPQAIISRRLALAGREPPVDQGTA